jgi:hypothetical protein
MGDDMSQSKSGGRQKRREIAFAAILIVCVVVVGAWEFLANRSRRPFEPFQINQADFKGFVPAAPDWTFTSLPLYESKLEPNVLAYVGERKGGRPSGHGEAAAWRGPIMLRLVHGYNMPDCMRIKYFDVQLLQDTRQGGGAWGGRRLQIWRLTSSSGDVSVWVTSMLRVGDFSETDLDTRSMAFPRVGTPDEPGWMPVGYRLSMLRHPVQTIRQVIQAKWNSARCDLATFLRLRQPAWASDDLLTLVATSERTGIRPGEEPSAIAETVAAHEAMYRQLKQWRDATLAAVEGTSPSGGAGHP